jgi:hypothetical protein
MFRRLEILFIASLSTGSCRDANAPVVESHCRTSEPPRAADLGIEPASTAMRFDDRGRVVFAVSRSAGDAFDRLTIKSWFSWNADGELTQIIDKSSRPLLETTELTTFRYGAHHELLAASMESEQRVVERRLHYVWNGSFESPPSELAPRLPPSSLPNIDAPLPQWLASPATNDPMPSLSFTGDVLVGDGDAMRVGAHYEHGVLCTPSQNDNTMSACGARGSELVLRDGSVHTTYVWGKGGILRARVYAGQLQETVDYEYAPDGNLAREKVDLGDGKPTYTTFSNACPAR